MTWLAPVVDKNDDRAASLTAYLPVPAIVLRRIAIALLAASLLAGIVTAVRHHVAIDLAALDFGVLVLYALLLGEPMRRIHHRTHVGWLHATAYLATALCLVGWSYTLPLADGAHEQRGYSTLTALAGNPHPARSDVGLLQTLSWVLLALTLTGAVAQALLVWRLGRRYAQMAGTTR